MPMIRTGLAMILCAAATTAPAQTATPDSENGRYSFSQIGDELVRLDGRTGQVSTCGKRAAGWSCMAVPDERTALETEITRLQGESAALKKELLARGVPLPSGIAGFQPSGCVQVIPAAMFPHSSRKSLLPTSATPPRPRDDHPVAPPAVSGE